MTQEEKLLLFKDLCARFPYGVKVWYNGASYVVPTINVEKEEIHIKSDATAIVGWWHSIEHIKPYLRSMSSMTEEEVKEFNTLVGYEEKDEWIRCNNICGSYGINIIGCSDMVDWLNAHHFDFRGLIEKELAIEAPEGMYN